jgi:rhamnosyltransferase
MKIVTIVALYQPKEEYLSNYYGYAAFSDRILFIDNSDKEESKIVEELSRIPKATYLSLKGNQGIAKALKQGMDIACQEKADYALTMDQDSLFPFDRFSTIKTILENNLDSPYGIIGLNFNSQETSLSLKTVRWWLTSGNFISVKKYVTLGQGFDERLFIDGVDADIGHSFAKKGYRIGYIPGISLIHHMGEPRKIRIGFIHFSTLNYSPLRYYYIFRNNNYLYSQDKAFFRKDRFNVNVKIYWKVRFFEKDKKKKLLAMRYGKQDARKALLGKCNHNDIQ